MKRCLNRKELEDFTEYAVNDKSIEEEELKTLIHNSESWVKGYEVILLNYLLSKIIQQRLNKRYSCSKFPEIIYQKRDCMSLQIQEFDSVFIDHLMCEINTNGTLEENLIELQQRISNYRYGKKLRD
jgi:hypothetical protein